MRIEGLSWQQRVFADILWSLNGPEDVNRFIRSLPQGMQAEAETVKQMIVAAMFDELTEDLSAAEDVIRSIK